MSKRKTEFIALANLHGCRACWECVDACPKNVLGKVSVLWHRHAIIRHADACIGCGKCIKVCMHGVIVGNQDPISRTARCRR